MSDVLASKKCVENCEKTSVELQKVINLRLLLEVMVKKTTSVCLMTERSQNWCQK